MDRYHSWQSPFPTLQIRLMRILTTITLFLTLAACSPGDPEPEPVVGEDWIEVPLPENVFQEFSGGFRQDAMSVTVPPGIGLELELAMREGDAIVYTWTASGLQDPGLLLSEFHGHTEREPSAPGTLMFYRRATGDTESGALVAPFDGLHGWYFRNDSGDTAVVNIDVAGFYDLVPD